MTTSSPARLYAKGDKISKGRNQTVYTVIEIWWNGNRDRQMLVCESVKTGATRYFYNEDLRTARAPK